VLSVRFAELLLSRTDNSSVNNNSCIDTEMPISTKIYQVVASDKSHTSISFIQIRRQQSDRCYKCKWRWTGRDDKADSFTARLSLLGNGLVYRWTLYVPRLVARQRPVLSNQPSDMYMCATVSCTSELHALVLHTTWLGVQQSKGMTLVVLGQSHKSINVYCLTPSLALSVLAAILQVNLG